MIRIIKMITVVIVVWMTLACKNNARPVADPDIYYTCSMDPQVVESKPGKCPICGMDLTPAKKSSSRNREEIMLSEQQIELGNINTDTIGRGTIGDELVLTGTFNVDQRKTVSVNARVMGRVDRLFFKNIGDYVPKGSPLYAIYSEDLNNAKQEYLLAAERKKAFLNDPNIDFEQLLQSAKNKLLLWGMTESQIIALEKAGVSEPLTTYFNPASGYITSLDISEGSYVMEGGSVMRLSDLSTLWVEAQMYTSQLSEIDRNGEVIVRSSFDEGRDYRGRIEFVNPEINPDTRINLIRVSVPNPGNRLKPGMGAYVILKSQTRNTLTLPIDAVIREEKGASVWVQTADKTFMNRMVDVGLESDNRIEIRSGLKAGDVVVMSGVYLLHSEYILKKGSDPMAGHAH